MRVLLVGNGLEIKYNPKFTKENIVKQMYAGEDANIANIKQNLSKFYNEHCLDYDLGQLNFTDEDYENIGNVVTDNIDDETIETIFTEISLALGSDDKLDKIKLIFLKYLDMTSKETEIPESVDLWKKLCDYQLIITTNYTNLIERVLDTCPASVKPIVVHIHGSFETDELKVLLGLDKNNKDNETELYEVKKLHLGAAQLFSKHQFVSGKRDTIKMDIFGMNVKQDEKIITNILRWMLYWIFYKQNRVEINTGGIAYNKSEIDSFIHYMEELFSVKYYWFMPSDKGDFVSLLYQIGNGEEGVFLNLLDECSLGWEGWGFFNKCLKGEEPSKDVRTYVKDYSGNVRDTTLDKNISIPVPCSCYDSKTFL